MPIARPRRIFRSGAIASRSQRSGFSATVVAGLVGALGGAVLVLLALPSDLFGRVPTPSGILTADPQHVAVIDGETLRLRDTVIHLDGIKAPPRGQPCQGTRDCGAAATDALEDLVRDRTVECSLTGRELSGYIKATCDAGGVQLNRALVASGYAKARTAADPFGAVEATARQSRLGLWRDGEF